MVTVAYLLWLAAAVGLVFVALLVLTAPVGEVRDALAAEGTTEADIDSYLATVRVVGVVSAVSGLVLGFLSGPMRAGHRTVRRVLVVLSVVVTLLLLFVVLGLQLFQELLVVALVLMAACALVYRPSAREWFARGR